MTPGQETLAQRCRRQAAWCAGEGEPLYDHLLRAAAGDVEAGGPCWEAMEPYASEPGEAAVALRFLAAVHRLVLDGSAPGLAAFYPSAGGRGRPEDAWPAFRELVAARAAELRARTALPCQTNEVGRAAALLPGLLAVARATRRPLRLLEVGCSAGLNLRLDHFHYGSWGPPDSPVQLTGLDSDPGPTEPRRLEVAARAGCDLHPIDPTTADGAAALAAFTWPSRPERLERLRGAIRLAREVPARVDQADALDWLAEGLLERVRATTVVYHSVFLQYLPEGRRARLTRLVGAAGRAAAAEAPLAWVRMEPGRTAFEVRVGLWPGGHDILLGTCGPHGGGFRWAA